MVISLIAAVSDNNVIGLNGDLPWKQSNDLKFFKRTTVHHHIIMGRKTFFGEGIGKPLPKRVNIVLTRQQNLQIKGATIVNTLADGLEIAKKAGETEVFIIGGAQIYQLALPIAHKIYLTRIHAQIQGDTFFPELDPNVWTLNSVEAYESDEKNQYNYTFTVWKKQKHQ